VLWLLYLSTQCVSLQLDTFNSICLRFLSPPRFQLKMGLTERIKSIFAELDHLGSQIIYYGKEAGGRLTFPFHPEKETVLLTHGYGARGRSLEYIATKLYEQQFNVIPIYYWFLGDLEKVGLRMVKTIRQYHQRQDSPRKLHLVAHSMGGLITCDASRIVPELVATATFLGTPFGGTQKARLGIGKSAEQLLPGSAYLQRLLEDGLPEEIKYTVVQGTRDEVVSEERSRLPLEQENITHYRIATGHLGLAGKKGYKVVKLALAGGEKSQIDLDQIHHGPGN